MPDIFTDKSIRHRILGDSDELLDQKNIQYKNPPHKLNILSSFVRDPMGIHIAEQHADEHILLFIRREFVSNSHWLTISLLFAIAPFFLSLIPSPLQIAFGFLSPMMLIFIGFFYYLIIAGYMFTNFVTWFYDIGIVTEERSIDIDFYNISYVSVATARSQDLKDVRFFQRGIFESLFDYGDVTLVVEASGETLTFEKTPHPAEVVSILSALIGGHQTK